MLYINFRVHEPGAGAGVDLAMAYGALGGARRPARAIKFDARTAAYTGKMELPAGTGGVDISVYRNVDGVWLLRGQLRAAVDALGRRPAAYALVQIAGTPGDPPRGELRPPRVELWLATGSKTRDELLLEHQTMAHELMRAALVDQPGVPPLLAYTVCGVAPFWATFLARVEAAPALAGDLLRLACLLDADEPADLADAGPVAQARVLARALTLLPTTIEYTPDVALVRGADAVSGAGATPDAPPRRPRGTMPTNTFDDAAATWADDCEGQTALAAAVWRAMGAADATRALAAQFRFVVLVITVRGGRAGAYHVCGALLPLRRGAAALLECVVRTCGIPADADEYTPPAGAYKRAERPLVRLRDGSLNNWYDRIVFAVDLARPTEMLLPHVAGRGGGTVAQLLAGDVALEPLGAPLSEALERRIYREREDMPAVDLRGVRVQLGAHYIDAQRPMEHRAAAPDADAAAIHVPDVLRNPGGSWFVF